MEAENGHHPRSIPMKLIRTVRGASQVSHVSFSGGSSSASPPSRPASPSAGGLRSLTRFNFNRGMQGAGATHPPYRSMLGKCPWTLTQRMGDGIEEH